MAFEGDLQEISLADVLQTLESNQKTGLLTVIPAEGDGGWLLALEGGALAAVARRDGAVPSPADLLVRQGWVDEEQAALALKRWRRARKKTLGKILEDMGLISREDWLGLVEQVIREEALLCLNAEKATFTFEEGEPPWDAFDPEQVDAGVRLAMGPLLLEAARRADEWERIRRNIGSETEVFFALDGDEPDVEDAVQAEVLDTLAGGMDLRTLLDELPYPRFEILKALSDLLEAGLVRAATPEELVDMAEEDLAAGAEERAVRRLRGALEVHRHDASLRIQLAEILEGLGREKEAARELALAAGDLEERGDGERAWSLLGRAVDLCPADPALRGRYLQACLREGAIQAAREEGLELARLYVSLGLADQARRALISLLKHSALKGDDSLLLQLAEVETLGGRLEKALEILMRMANLARKKGEEKKALDLYQRVLGLVPDHGEAKKAIEEVKTGLFQRKKAVKRRLVWVGILTALCTGSFIWVLHEVAGRSSLMRAYKEALEDSTWGRPAAAIPVMRVVAETHPLTFAGREARERAAGLAELEKARVESLLARGEYGPASMGLLRLKEDAQGVMPRKAWWELLGKVILGASAAPLSSRREALLLWSLGRITGIQKKDLSAWRAWWNRSGSQFP